MNESDYDIDTQYQEAKAHEITHNRPHFVTLYLAPTGFRLICERFLPLLWCQLHSTVPSKRLSEQTLRISSMCLSSLLSSCCRCSGKNYSGGLAYGYGSYVSNVAGPKTCSPTRAAFIGHRS